MLQVTAPAPDYTLLTIAELRAAVKATDNSKDADLKRLEAQVASTLTKLCNVLSDGVHLPTLRLETITETFRVRHGHRGLPFNSSPVRHHHAPKPDLLLSRRPIVSVVSVTEPDGVLTADQYEAKAAAGILTRLRNDVPSNWNASKIVVVYTAGYADVPPDLKLAAIKFVQDIWFADLRDPDLRRDRIEGLADKEYWQPQPDAPAVPQDIMSLLVAYTNEVVG